MRTKYYYPLLDLLRIFAAFWVMNFHYLGALGTTRTLSWYRYGNLGVQLFLIVSGFVIIQSLEGKSFGEFAKSRFIRLFPLFWFLCTVTYVLTLVMPHASPLNFTGYLANMTMLPDVINGALHHGGLVDASYWTLTVELLFYAGNGLFCHLFSFKNIRLFLGGWLLISAIVFVIHGDHNFYAKLLLVRHASYFIFGSALGLIATGQAKVRVEKYIDWILLGASALFSIIMNTRAIPEYLNPNSHGAVIVTIIIAAFLIIVPMLVYLSSYVKNPRIIDGLAVIGGLTYPIYLLHQRIGIMMINYFTSRYHIAWNVFAIFFEAVVVLVAYGLYVQDKKVRTWLRRILK